MNYMVPLLLAFCVAAVNAQVQSTNDLWDVSQGMTITRSSAVDNCGRDPAHPYDPRDVFGGNFANCPGENFLFQDNAPANFVHFIEWKTAAPVTVRSFNLWTTGDGALTDREFDRFRLLTKSPGASDFDVLVYDFTPSHPYQYVADIYSLLVSTDVKPVTAQEFRAEFVNRTNSNLSPRLIELDGFSEFTGPRATARVSQVEVAWPSVKGLHYQVEYRVDLPGSNWVGLGGLVTGDGTTMRITDPVASDDKRRFYRVRAVE